jgi:hypothetical protein
MIPLSPHLFSHWSIPLICFSFHSCPMFIVWVRISRGLRSRDFVIWYIKKRGKLRIFETMNYHVIEGNYRVQSIGYKNLSPLVTPGYLLAKDLHYL